MAWQAPGDFDSDFSTFRIQLTDPSGTSKSVVSRNSPINVCELDPSTAYDICVETVSGVDGVVGTTYSVPVCIEASTSKYFKGAQSDCFNLFSNFWRFWYKKKAPVFLITHVKFHRKYVPGYGNHN